MSSVPSRGGPAVAIVVAFAVAACGTTEGTGGTTPAGTSDSLFGGQDAFGGASSGASSGTDAGQAKDTSVAADSGPSPKPDASGAVDGAASGADAGAGPIDAGPEDAGPEDTGPVDPCDKGITAKEGCDGIDNDCDGKTDEDTCNDGNPCTEDACKGAAGCEHKKLDGVACDADGNACTEDDKCVAGTCAAGQKLLCDDKDPCTFDVCLPASGCTVTNNDGAPCDADGDPCTISDSCFGGFCKKGSAKICNDANGCTKDSCDPKNGACKFDSLAMDKQPCDADGNACTSGDACNNGACVAGKKLTCDDKNPCTDDSCDPKTGCVHKKSEKQGKCEDGDKCTYDDKCIDGSCVGTVLKCPGPSHSCIASVACKKETGICTPNPAPDGQPCDDNNKCTTGDACKAGKCAFDKNVCGDVTLEAVADAAVWKGSGGSNYGSSKEIYVGQSFHNKNKRYGFVRFDMSGLPAGAKVEKVEFRMTAFKGYAYGNDGNVYTLYVPTDTWDEKKLNWNNQPATQGSALGKWWLWYNHKGGTKVGVNKDPLLAKQVEKELAGDRVLSLRIHSPGYETRYRSREYSKKNERPQLYIKYAKP